MAKITVTQEQVNENMQDISVKTIEEFGKKITHVTVRMKNGFILTEDSVCVDPANYDVEIGKKIALSRIEDKIWFLLGYALQDKVSRTPEIPTELIDTKYMMESPDYKERFRAEYFQVLIRTQKLSDMLKKWDRGELTFKPTCERYVYDDQLRAMVHYLSALEERAGIEEVDISTERKDD